MRVYGIDQLTAEQVERKLQAGARFVFYEYCISLIFASLRGRTAVYLLRPDELGLLRGSPYTLLTLVLGWWGIPWGFIYTPLAIITNMGGGCDVTPAVRAWLQSNLATDAGA